MRQTLTRTAIGSIYGLGSVPVGHLRNHYVNLRPSFDPGDEGGGGTGEGSGEGNGGGTGEGGGGEGDDATLQAKAIALADTKGYIKVPGYDKPVKVADLLDAHKLSGTHKQSLTVMGQIAAALKAQGGKGKGAEGGEGGRRAAASTEGDGVTRREAKSITDRLKEMELLDGKSLAPFMQELMDGTLSPMNKVLVALAKRQGAVEQALGKILGDNDEKDFSTQTERILGALKFPKAAGAEVLADLVRDHYLSYDDGERGKVTEKMMTEAITGRVKSLRTYFRNLEKAELEDAQKRQRDRIFAKPGANSSANGKRRAPASNSQIADLLFGKEGASTGA